jgi:hypothetical protein
MGKFSVELVIETKATRIHDLMLIGSLLASKQFEKTQDLSQTRETGQLAKLSRSARTSSFAQIPKVNQSNNFSHLRSCV